MKKINVKDLTQVALIAALYVVLTITPPLNAISYGAYQFRVSEVLNFTAFYNRKYLLGITLGCMIANLYSFGWIDVFVGGLSTLIFVGLGITLFKKYMDVPVFGGATNLAFIAFSFFFAASMFTIALELHVLQGLPFFLTWFTTAAGELASLLVGAFLMPHLAKYIDFKS